MKLKILVSLFTLALILALVSMALPVSGQRPPWPDCYPCDPPPQLPPCSDGSCYACHVNGCPASSQAAAERLKRSPTHPRVKVPK